MKNLFICGIVVIFMIGCFFGGIQYSRFSLNQRLVNIRAQDLGREGIPSTNAAQSINDDVRRIADERELLKKHIEINEKYLSSNDIDGLRKWTSKMKAELSK